jgi:hypothetical protein
MSEKGASGEVSLHAKIRTAIEAADLHYGGRFKTDDVHQVIERDAQISRTLAAAERAGGPRVARIMRSAFKRITGDVLRHEPAWIPNDKGKPKKHRRFLAHRADGQTWWTAFYLHDAKGYSAARAAGEARAQAIMKNLKAVQIGEQLLLPLEDGARGAQVRDQIAQALREEDAG